MKKLILFVVAALCGATGFAQVQSDIRTATLIHGDQTSIFYGANALNNAYNAAAQDGDIIVLSPGEFNSPSQIQKSISIYGAGYETDTISGAAPTSLSSISVAAYTDSDESGEAIDVYPTVQIEGVLLTTFGIWASSRGAILENLVVRKCQVKDRVSINAATKDCKFSQCVIDDNWNLSGYLHNQLNFENCWIRYAYGSKVESTVMYDHCIIRGSSSDYAHYSNCILETTLGENSTANNCIFTTSSMGSNVTGTGNWTGLTVESIFVDAENGFNYTPANNFALRYPEKYIGTDGTQVGINGGNAPFDRISPIPRILSSDIDITTSKDGKLNVSIRVEAQTKE